MACYDQGSSVSICTTCKFSRPPPLNGPCIKSTAGIPHLNPSTQVLPQPPQTWPRLACVLAVSWGDICSLTIKPPAGMPRSSYRDMTDSFFTATVPLLVKASLPIPQPRVSRALRRFRYQREPVWVTPSLLKQQCIHTPQKSSRGHHKKHMRGWGSQICITSHFGVNLCWSGLSAAGMITAGSERSTAPSILSSTILWIEMRKTSSFLGDDNICIYYQLGY